jgi:hypothetical protein
MRSDWFPLVVLLALLLVASAIAPPVEFLMGLAR